MQNGTDRPTSPGSPRYLGAKDLIAMAIIAVLVLGAALYIKSRDNPLAGMHCPAPDFAVMTPTGPGCGQSITIQVGGKP